eukprot:1169649-Prymnesium_polylepis.1
MPPAFLSRAGASSVAPLPCQRARPAAAEAQLRWLLTVTSRTIARHETRRAQAGVESAQSPGSACVPSRSHARRARPAGARRAPRANRSPPP